MNRRLHNTFLALAASGAMLAVLLAVGAPAPVADPGIAGARPGPAAADSAPGPVADAAEPETARAPRRAQARSRQSVVMPYFSFARRG
ncbi:MAG: hypothetical protein ACLGHW_01050 [Gammaproteobacteria bacterium]|jgi:hypothetical protein